MAQYTMIIQPAGDNFTAYCPDVPGCSVTGSTASEGQHLFVGVLVKHLKTFQVGGGIIPAPPTVVGTIDVPWLAIPENH